MKISKKLLPMKAHYFFISAGTSPIFPYVPVILKDLGFSSIAVGWIFTAYPLSTIICKPLFGTLADRFRCHRFLFICLLFFHLIAMFGIQWIPGLPFTTTAELVCEGDPGLRICSEKLRDNSYLKKIVTSFNYTNRCQVETANWKNLLGSEETKNEVGSSFEDQKVSIKLGPSFLLKEDCLVIEIADISSVNSTDDSKHCGRNVSLLSSILCEDPGIMDLITKPLVQEGEETWTHQFWIAFVLVVSVRIVASIVLSFSDAFCFVLLGDKRENYGMQRMWGAVSWGLVSFLNGILVDSVSRGLAKKNFLPSYYLMLVLLLIDVIVALNIKAKFDRRPSNIASDLKKLLRHIRVWIFILWCFICGIFCALIWNFLFWFIEDLALSNPEFDMKWIKTLEGLVLTVHCYFGEIPFFFFSGWILRKLSHRKTMVVVLFFYSVRFLMYSTLNDPWWILPIEVLNGVTFGLFYTTMVTYASLIAPEGTEVTVQNFVSSVFDGAGLSVGSLLGGYFFKKLGSSKTFFIFGTSALVTGFLYLLLQPKLVAEKKKREERKETDEKEDKEIIEEETEIFNKPS